MNPTRSESLTSAAAETSRRPISGIPALLGVAVVVSAFNYVAVTQPTYDRLRKLENQVALLAGGVDRLVGEASRGDVATSVLARLIKQRSTAAGASCALDEIEALHVRLNRGAEQLARLTAIDARLAELARRAAQTDRLVDASQAGLRRVDSLERTLKSTRTAAERAAVQVSQLAAVQRRLTSMSGVAEQAAPIADQLCDLAAKVADTSSQSSQAEEAAASLVAVQETVLSDLAAPEAIAESMVRLEAVRLHAEQSDLTLAACEAGFKQICAFRDHVVESAEGIDAAQRSLAALDSLLAELSGIEGSVSRFREVMVDLVLMQPAIDRAVAALKPASQLPLVRQTVVAPTRMAATTETSEK